jgi:phosphohistidine phosphatase SixA
MQLLLSRLETWQRGELLARLDVRPQLYLTSPYRHPREMADLLAAQLGGEPVPHVVSLDGLKPKRVARSFEHLMDEAKKQGVDPASLSVIAIIGHEDTLSLLLTRLTAQRSRPFTSAEVVCLTAPGLVDFLQGHATIAFRLPVADFQEAALIEKIQSKMTVATWLAGFAFVALVAMLMRTQGNEGLRTWPPWPLIAMFGLLAATALLITAVYIYDQLTMPAGFWLFGGSRRRRFWSNAFTEQQHEQGALYAHMVWTWQWVFSLGVGAGLIGFFALLFSTGQWVLTGGGLVVVILVFIYYWLIQPRLGTN